MKAIRARILSGKSGATAIEYALIGALVAMVIITAVTTMGDSVGSAFEVIGPALAPGG